MTNAAMFGGSFNPVHNGHVELLERMIFEFHLDKVIVIPTNVTPLKDNSFMAAAEDRLAMCRLAFSHVPAIEVSDMEITREGKSYTVDTLKMLKEKYADAKLHLIVGADAFLQLPLWYKAEEIFSLAKILTIVRDDIDCDSLKRAGESYKEKFGAECGIIENPVTDISSTEIRSLIKENSPVSELLPSDVYNFIKENELYGYKNQ